MGFGGGVVVQILVQIGQKNKDFSFKNFAEILTGIELPLLDLNQRPSD